MPPTISTDQFRERIEAICLRGGVREWPRKPLDQHVLLKSAIFGLEPHREYSEAEINERLAPWCDDVARNMYVDHAVLRRYLVDAGYLIRDAAGAGYRLNEEKTDPQFDPAVATIDPAVVLQDARRRNEERKRKYLAQQEQADDGT
ncbi:MAG: DUF2087 domain-containing protein [Chloroflexota bacterium]